MRGRSCTRRATTKALMTCPLCHFSNTKAWNSSAIPADDAHSIKSIFRALKNRQPMTASLLGSLQPLTFQRLIQVQVCIVYLYAAFHKLNMGYLSGLVLNYIPGRFLLVWKIGNGLPGTIPGSLSHQHGEFCAGGATSFSHLLHLWCRRPYAGTITP